MGSDYLRHLVLATSLFSCLELIASICRENACGRYFGSEKPTTFHSLLALFTMAGKGSSGAPEDRRNRQIEEVFCQASEMGRIELMTNAQPMIELIYQIFDKLRLLRKTTNVTDNTLTSILTPQKSFSNTGGNFSNTCGKECIKDVHEDLHGNGKIIGIFQESHGSCLCWEGTCKHNCKIVIEYFVDAFEFSQDEEKAMYVSTAYHKNGKCGCRARL